MSYQTPFGDNLGYSHNSQYKPFIQYSQYSSFNMLRNTYYGMRSSFSQQSKKSNKERPAITSIIGIGEPLVGIAAQVENDFIQKYGLDQGNTVIVNENDNKRLFDELERKAMISYIPGGSVQNTLRIASKCINMNEMNQGKFKFTLLGCVGDDLYKEKILNSLRLSGVIPLFQESKDVKSSRCAIGIYKKERYSAMELLASKNLSDNFILQHQDEILSHQALLIEGYSLQNKIDICKKLSELFIKQKKKIMLTLSSAFMVKFFYDKIIEIADKSDIIIGNIDEYKELSQGKGESLQDILHEVHSKLVPRDRLLIVTAKNEGVFCSKYNYTNKQLEYILQNYAKKINDEDMIDSIGAGDAFFGGFLSEYLKGSQINQCCKIGNDAAYLTLSNIGCTITKNQKLNIDD